MNQEGHTELAENGRDKKAQRYADIVSDIMLVRYIQYSPTGITLLGELYADATDQVSGRVRAEAHEPAE